MFITGIILAAGASSRMGSTNKLLLPFRKHTVIEEAVEQVFESAVDDIVTITGHQHELIEERLVEHVCVRFNLIHNPDYMKGRAESIKCAIRHVHEKADAALFLVADKPGVTSRLINRAIDLFKAEIPAVLYVQTPFGRGHPIIFAKKVFNDLLALHGDVVGDAVVAKYAHDTSVLRDDNEQIDVDTEADYRILLQQERER